jgi:putative ribosome biogenesis GTPase RsgA
MPFSKYVFRLDWKYIKEHHQKMIIQNNERENARRVPHTYVVGDYVMVEQHHHRKYGQPGYMGPFTVDCVNENGTIRLRQKTATGGMVYCTWNIRTVHPYKD